MIFGTILIYALCAGVFAFIVELICTRLNAPGWLSRVLYGTSLVYSFWFLLAHGPITIGQ